MSFLEFLNKPMFYKKIDFDRMPRAYEIVKNKLNLTKIIHIIGTNGKGSTGRFLAQILMQNGKKVGHYTSPHIFNFNERFWLNGKDATNDELEMAHNKISQILPQEVLHSLTYFEWATFLAAFLFEDCDEVIFEAGMGGEFDATNVFAKKMTIFTPIGLDHMENLGANIEEISATKFRAMSDFVVISDEMNDKSLEVARKIAKENKTKLKFAREFLNIDDLKSIKNYSQNYNLPEFLNSNLTLAFASAKALSQSPNLDTLSSLKIRARCEKIAKNITIDVGHNELGARAILREFEGKKVNLIYNSFLNKDYEKILEILKPVIKKIEILDYKCDERELVGEKILPLAQKFGIEISKFEKINDDEEYLVFGSFLLVENFLRHHFEK